MEKLTLQSDTRTLLGKKVKSLRRQGLLPANIYGKDVPSTSITVSEKKFREVLHQAGETGLVYLEITGEENYRPVLVHEVQRHPVTDASYHVDFYQVNLKVKTTANVPIVLVGENELETRGEGLLIQTLQEIAVEALPADIPHNFEIDITQLTEIGQSVKVADLKYDRDKVTITTDEEENILVLQEAQDSSAEEEVIEEATAPEVIGEKSDEEESSEENKSSEG